jgi:DMSO/TMAO reductase YedYZ molybdopterin-dependent catalytic subunit
MRLTALFLFLLTSTSLADTPSIQLAGDLDHPAKWTIDQIKSTLSSEIKSIEFTTHGQKHSYDCVPLLSLLKAAGARTDLKMGPTVAPHIKNLALRLVVVITASDGYTVSFSLAELLPQIGNREAWLALDQDNQPFPPRDAPARLIVPGDTIPARSIHAISEIDLIDPTAPTTQSSTQTAPLSP